MSLDLRTRLDGPRPALDPREFFTTVLPARIGEHAALIRAGAAWLAPRPLVLEVDGACWRLAWSDARIDIAARDDERAARVRLTAAQLDDLVADQRTFVGFHASGQLDQPAGTLADLNDWWLLLRAALDGRAIYTPGSITFADRGGGSLDLHRTFRPDDDRAEMRHFLEQAGFLHIAALFDRDAMAAISSDMDRAAPHYAPRDGKSWWAKTSDGVQRLVRMQGFQQHSPTTAALLEDRRFRSLADIPGDGHAFDGRKFNCIEALFKPIGVVEGISDVPWHKDCGLGRHSYDCCGVTVGISVTGADATSGQLRVVAGSHRVLMWPARQRPGSDLPEIDLPTETGDVTIHLSCTTHMAQPPTARERRVMYTGFSLPPRDAQAAAAGRAGLYAVREAAPVTVSQEPSAARR